MFAPERNDLFAGAPVDTASASLTMDCSCEEELSPYSTTKISQHERAATLDCRTDCNDVDGGCRPRSDPSSPPSPPSCPGNDRSPNGLGASAAVIDFGRRHCRPASARRRSRRRGSVPLWLLFAFAAATSANFREPLSWDGDGGGLDELRGEVEEKGGPFASGLFREALSRDGGGNNDDKEEEEESVAFFDSFLSMSILEPLARDGEIGEGEGDEIVAPSEAPTKSNATTAEPSPDSTAAPTTETPSREPTRSPSTAKLTDEPTLRPTLGLTESPSTSPMTSPTTSPTLGPIKSLTSSPTPEPTGAPTTSPLEPTSSPTTGPTRDPTQIPTPAPTASPTESPVTNAPTDGPMAKPTRAPLAEPTRYPTLLPTTQSPTRSPTWAPTTGSSATERPTTESTEVPRRGPYTVNSDMVLRNAEILDTKTSKETWESVTGAHILSYISSRGMDDVVDPEVTVSVTSQEIVQSVVRRTLISWGGEVENVDETVAVIYRNSRRGRGLATSDPLQIKFDVSVTFRSSNDDYGESDVADWVGGGFVSWSDQQKYIEKLQMANGSAFGSVSRVVLTVDGEVVTEYDEEEDDGNDNTLYYIIGGVAGGGVLIFIISAGWYCKSRKRKRESPGEVESVNPDVTNVGSIPSSTGFIEMIESRRGETDDMSSIGYPDLQVIPPAVRDVGGNSITSVGDDYNPYIHGGIGRARANTNTSSTRESSTANISKIDGMSHFSDNDSFEAQFTDAYEHVVVDAPAGKLGIVVDNPDLTIPVVHGIKEASVLHGQVRVGDRLLQVDATDCNGWSAMNVSKLISSRSENSSRKLVLLRGASPNA